MTIILAKILGLYFLGIGVALLFNLKRFKELYQQIAQNNIFCYLGGVLALFLGAFIVSVHNVWVMEWPVTLTILGWLSLIKGFWLLVCYRCVQVFSFMSQRSNVFYKIIGVFVTLLGIFFTYQGWR